MRCTVILAEERQLDGTLVGETAYPQMEPTKKLKPVRKKIVELFVKQEQLLLRAALLEAEVRLFLWLATKRNSQCFKLSTAIFRLR